MSLAIITGAAGGIGLALTRVCLQRGMHVVMADKDQLQLEKKSTELLAEFTGLVSHYPCDVTNNQEVAALAQHVEQQHTRIDWIFNNAGIIGPLAPAWELGTEPLHQVMEVNLFGMINVIRAFFPILFKQTHRAHLINMASLYALCSGSNMAAYSMSKHAVLALSESLHFDLQRLEKPIDISVVFPSFTDTGLLTNTESTHNTAFHQSLNTLLARSRSAQEVAEYIVSEVEKNRFYILPDKEVKGYCEKRTESIVLQETPHKNSIEQLMSSLIRRNALKT